MIIINDIYPDGSPVRKSDVRSDDREGHRRNIASIIDVRNAHLSGQFAGIYVRELQGNFDLDTSDSTSLDDGATCIIDLDGNRFKLVPLAGGNGEFSSLQVGGGNWLTTPAFEPVTNTKLIVVPPAAVDTPDPVMAIQKTTTYTGESINPTLHVATLKRTSSSSGGVTPQARGILSELVDFVGGSTGFVESARIIASGSAGVAHGSITGANITAYVDKGPGTSFYNLGAVDAQISQYVADAPIPSLFNQDHFSSCFAATNGIGGEPVGHLICDAAYMINPYSANKFQSGFFIPIGGNTVAHTGFYCGATCVNGVDVSGGSYSGYAFKANGFTVDNTGAAVSKSLNASDGTVNALFAPSSLFTHSAVVGTFTNHNFAFVTNNVLAAYFDTSGKLNLGASSIRQGALSLSGLTSGTVSINVQAAAGTYNFNLPISAGAAGQPLLSGGGGAAAQTYGTLGVAAGGTGDTGTAWTSYTPTISAAGGSFGSITGAVGRYKDIGKTRFISVVFTVATVGSATTGASVSMPNGAAASTQILSGGNITDNAPSNFISIANGSANIFFVPAGFTWASGKTYGLSGTIEIS